MFNLSVWKLTEYSSASTYYIYLPNLKNKWPSNIELNALTEHRTMFNRMYNWTNHVQIESLFYFELSDVQPECSTVELWVLILNITMYGVFVPRPIWIRSRWVQKRITFLKPSIPWTWCRKKNAQIAHSECKLRRLLGRPLGSDCVKTCTSGSILVLPRRFLRHTNDGLRW